MLNRHNQGYDLAGMGWETAYARPGAFTGSANARGDHDGTQDPTTLFTVTGDVLVRIFGVCTVALAGASATIEVGVTGNTAGLLALTTGTDIDANDIWFAAAPADIGVTALSDVATPILIVNSLNIIETLKTANLTGGDIYYVCIWRRLSGDGNVVGS